MEEEVQKHLEADQNKRLTTLIHCHIRHRMAARRFGSDPISSSYQREALSVFTLSVNAKRTEPSLDYSESEQQ